MITSVFLLQNQNGLEKGSKHGRRVAGLENTQSRAGSKTDCKSFDLQKAYHKKGLDDLRTLVLKYCNLDQGSGHLRDTMRKNVAVFQPKTVLLQWSTSR